MFQVIDTFQITEASLRDHAEIRERYPTSGVVAVVDPAEALDLAALAGATVRVHVPDGSVAEHRVAAAHRAGTAVGLFFADTAESLVPPLSAVEIVRSDANI